MLNVGDTEQFSQALDRECFDNFISINVSHPCRQRIVQMMESAIFGCDKHVCYFSRSSPILPWLPLLTQYADMYTYLWCSYRIRLGLCKLSKAADYFYLFAIRDSVCTVDYYFLLLCANIHNANLSLFILNQYVGRTLKFIITASHEINVVSEAKVTGGDGATVVVQVSCMIFSRSTLTSTGECKQPCQTSTLFFSEFHDVDVHRDSTIGLVV